MDGYKKENSVSDTQIKVENYLFNRFRDEHDIPKLERNHLIVLSHNPYVAIKPDIYCEHPRIIGEIHSHLGKLKPSQVHKIAADILKMNLYEKNTGDCKKYYSPWSNKKKHKNEIRAIENSENHTQTKGARILIKEDLRNEERSTGSINKQKSDQKV